MVWAASPTSTVLPWHQVWLLTWVKRSHRAGSPRDRLINEWPAKGRSKIFSSSRMLSSLPSESNPRACQVLDAHSTMQVLSPGLEG